MSVGATPAAAEATIHLRNGRTFVVRDYWYAGDWLMFRRGRGTVGVPRAFVTALEPSPSRKIGAAPEGVNAAPHDAPSMDGTLVAPGSIR